MNINTYHAVVVKRKRFFFHFFLFLHSKVKTKTNLATLRRVQKYLLTVQAKKKMYILIKHKFQFCNSQ